MNEHMYQSTDRKLQFEKFSAHAGGRLMEDHEGDARLFSQKICTEITDKANAFARGGGPIYVWVASWWDGAVRWGRNRVTLASDRRDVQLVVSRKIGGEFGSSLVNQIDDASIETVVRTAEYLSLREPRRVPDDMAVQPPPLPILKPLIWSSATFNTPVEHRCDLARAAPELARVREMLSAGYLEVRGGSFNFNDSSGAFDSYFNRFTQAQCSTTVRHPRGTGSGWAGASSYDFEKLDTEQLAGRALDKCLASLNPVRIEPGRYTVILEPQAVADLVNMLVIGDRSGQPFDRRESERGRGPFVAGVDAAVGLIRSKLGLKVIDERISISHDPMDSSQGMFATPGVQKETLIENGVLKTLFYDRLYALVEKNENTGAITRGSYYMSGGTATIDDMIATTKRGLLVTRFWGVRILDPGSVLSTGTTRDGLWLVENGKITKAVNNMRFTESPLFVLNQVEQLGPSVPVYSPGMPVRLLWIGHSEAIRPTIVPALKSLDFSFTSTTDAI